MNINSCIPVLCDGDTYKVTSPFGFRVDPVTGKGNNAHKGIDLVLWKGYSSLSAIGAAWDGVVIAAKDGITGFSQAQSRGNYVIVDHGNGLRTHYYHLACGSVAVEQGDRVHQGMILGYMGATGYVTGAHLHFQIEQNGVPVDPYPYIIGEAGAGNEEQEQEEHMGEWWEEALEWAQQNGIIYGDENGNLMLDEPCTRRQMVVFLHRLYKLITEGKQ